VTFPSTVMVEELAQSTNYMGRHQGGGSTDGVEVEVTGLDAVAVSDGLGFINGHDAVAAANLLGGDARVGYQYGGRTYVGPLRDAVDGDTCIARHDRHSTFRNPDQWSARHLSVVTEADLS